MEVTNKIYRRWNFKQNKVVIRIYLHIIVLFVHKHIHTQLSKAEQSLLSHLTCQIGTCLSATFFSLAGNSGHKLSYGLRGRGCSFKQRA